MYSYSNLLKSTLLLSVVLATLPLSAMSAGNVIAEPATVPQPTIPKQVMLSKTKQMAEQEQKVLKEADDVVVAIHKALLAVENTDGKRANLLLQEAAITLDSILKKYPNIALVAANVDADVIEFEGDVAAAKKAVETADDLLDDGRVQEARQLLSQLQSELQITTTRVPLNSFPKAIKEAEVFLQKAKYNEAASAIYDLLHTLVVTTDILPLPIIQAELLLTEAAEHEHKHGLATEQHRTAVLALANAAHEQLKLAEVLGYGDKLDYKTLYSAMEELEVTVATEKVASVLGNLKTQLTALKEKLMHRIK